MEGQLVPALALHTCKSLMESDFPPFCCSFPSLILSHRVPFFSFVGCLRALPLQFLSDPCLEEGMDVCEMGSVLDLVASLRCSSLTTPGQISHGPGQQGHSWLSERCQASPSYPVGLTTQTAFWGIPAHQAGLWRVVVQEHPTSAVEI